MAEIYRDLNAQLERFVNQGSAWQLNGITEFVVHIAQYRPARRISRRPPLLSINVLLWMWRTRARSTMFPLVFHPVMKHSERLTKYEAYMNEMNWTGIYFSTPLHQIRTFERNNPSVTINVYTSISPKNRTPSIQHTSLSILHAHIELIYLYSQKTIKSITLGFETFLHSSHTHRNLQAHLQSVHTVYTNSSPKNHSLVTFQIVLNTP